MPVTADSKYADLVTSLEDSAKAKVKAAESGDFGDDTPLDYGAESLDRDGVTTALSPDGVETEFKTKAAEGITAKDRFPLAMQHAVLAAAKRAAILRFRGREAVFMTAALRDRGSVQANGYISGIMRRLPVLWSSEEELD